MNESTEQHDEMALSPLEAIGHEAVCVERARKELDEIVRFGKGCVYLTSQTLGVVMTSSHTVSSVESKHSLVKDDKPKRKRPILFGDDGSWLKFAEFAHHATKCKWELPKQDLMRKWGLAN